ncbi:RNA-directed DNA polymerase, eukaryota, Reverse transcriptase zinc-binding domain protein [Artemisia annua]|uniref:RNA-directed DNA polymerase, eukaryota, Reverse transcriptase zinc-binding domain protein n=1 Tax=Artemisia annua TaxID=35608 RepID=A0A2U1P2V7_ARTAN|nr:RNA-directed DNA polymerase, eukaryota, Reverse transcriptase zinc-binding domain protein [Artemisia annua]
MSQIADPVGKSSDVNDGTNVGSNLEQAYGVSVPSFAKPSVSSMVHDKPQKHNVIIKEMKSEEVSKVKMSDDGFTEVKRKKARDNKNSKKQVEEVRLTKPALSLQYHRVEKGETSKQKASSNESMKSVAQDDDATWGTYSNVSHVVNDSNSEDVDEYITMEERKKSDSQESSKDQGASTPFEGNHDEVDVSVIHQDPQVIHTRVWNKADRKELFCSFVYAHNYYIHRRPLWNGLCLHKQYINNKSWCLLGDFNASLYVDDTSIGPSTLDITMREFKECFETMEDRFVGAHAIFKPYRISDHSPSVISIPSLVKAFYFANYEHQPVSLHTTY